MAVAQHPFVVYVACDVNGAKLNTGIEFDTKPRSWQDLVGVVEALYSKERQMQSGNPDDTFRCASCMVVQKSPYHPGGTQWVETKDIYEIPNKAQLFVFDWSSPAPPKGGIPPVQFVVRAHQVEYAVMEQSRDPSRPADAALSARPHSSVSSSATRESVGGVPSSRTPSSRFKARSPPRVPTAGLRTPAAATGGGTGGQGGAYPTPLVSTPPPISLPRGSESNTAGLHSNLPSNAHEFLFRQLCAASGSDDTVSSQRLHTIFVENDLMIGTDTFSVMVHHQSRIDQQQWRRIVEEYGPVVDALYERIASKDRSAPAPSPEIGKFRQEVDRHTKKLRELEDEEQELIARQAQIKHDILMAQRGLRVAQSKLDALQSEVLPQPEDRGKESEMLQKFVALKVRQVKLMEEEARVNHELSLL